MALEILEETGYTELADYWSLGVIFYELCFGVTPFDSYTVEETLMKIAYALALCNKFSDQTRCWEDYVIAPDSAADEETLSKQSWDLIHG